MIIKYTFNDNDFTQIIEKYLDEFGPFYAFNYPTAAALDEFIELKDKYDDFYDKYIEEKTITLDEVYKIKEKLLVILKANFIQYIANIRPNSNWSTDGFTAEELQNDKEYIINSIKISIVRSIPAQPENGEVVYYVTNRNNYIVM